MRDLLDEVRFLREVNPDKPLPSLSKMGKRVAQSIKSDDPAENPAKSAKRPPLPSGKPKSKGAPPPPKGSSKSKKSKDLAKKLRKKLKKQKAEWPKGVRFPEKRVQQVKDLRALIADLQKRYAKRQKQLDKPLRLLKGKVDGLSPALKPSKPQGKYQTSYWNAVPSTQGWYGDR